jgi:chemotaxis protein methyltransferase CheR
MGLQFEDTKLGFLAEVLRRRVEGGGGNPDAYLSSLEASRSNQELGALAHDLTVGETYFFRHMDQFRAFAEVALPERLSKRRNQKTAGVEPTLQILSAGCASGEEAYSLAILVREASVDLPGGVSIRGVDVNPLTLKKAIQGRFSNWALRETPPEVQRKWFRQDGRDAVLNDTARSGVRFEERNLLDDDDELWPPGAYDIIFCRNVIMYFTPDSAHALIARITRALAPGGYLFLGHAETLRGLSQDFHLRHTHETFYYQRKNAVSVPTTARPNTPFPGTVSARPAAVEVDGSWVDAIHKAAERIRSLATPTVESTPVVSVPPRDMRLALDLMQRERFSEALDVLRDLPPELAGDPDVLLLHAVLLVHSGQLSSAEETCRQLLALDDLNAGAHYVLALCMEGVGDRGRAAEHDEIAVYLDPGFAMPHLHLGLIARRVGDREIARRELEQAISLLEREDAARLLLFGGGFQRESLIALCRAELSACGEQ